MTDPQTIDYFELLVVCADQVEATRPEKTSARFFWRKRIAAAHRELNSFMSEAWGEMGAAGWAGYHARLMVLLAQLARECHMAAYSFGAAGTDTPEDAEAMAKAMAELTASKSIKV